MVFSLALSSHTTYTLLPDSAICGECMFFVILRVLLKLTMMPLKRAPVSVLDLNSIEGSPEELLSLLLLLLCTHTTYTLFPDAIIFGSADLASLSMLILLTNVVPLSVLLLK